MKINNKKVIIPVFEEGKVGDELILYSSENEKIIMLNSSASYMHNFLKDCQKKGMDVTTDDICTEFLSAYTESVPEYCELLRDIQETLEMLINEMYIIDNYE